MYKRKDWPIPKWDITNIAWVAGVIEGEGHISTLPGGRMQVRVQMTDEDVIRKLHATLGIGNVHGPYSNDRKTRVGADTKPLYYWAVGRKPHVKRVLQAIYPFMGARRARKIEQVLGFTCT